MSWEEESALSGGGMARVCNSGGIGAAEHGFSASGEDSLGFAESACFESGAIGAGSNLEGGR